MAAIRGEMTERFTTMLDGSERRRGGGRGANEPKEEEKNSQRSIIFSKKCNPRMETKGGVQGRHAIIHSQRLRHARTHTHTPMQTLTRTHTLTKPHTHPTPGVDWESWSTCMIDRLFLTFCPDQLSMSK